MNRRNAPPRKHEKKPSDLRTVVERLEPRAMLAGLGQDSFSGLGPTTAVLLPGVSSPPGIVLTGGSPTLGSAAGNGSSTPNGPVLFSGTGSGTGSSTGGSDSSTPNGPVLFGGTGSATGSSTSGSGSSIPNGPVLFGGTGSGTGSSTSGTGSSTPNGPVLFGGSGSGTGSSTSMTGSSPDPNSPVLLSQYTGGSTAGTQGSGTNNGGTLSGSDLWLLYSAGLGAGSSSSGASGGSSSNLLTLLSQYQEGSNVGGQGNGTGGTLSNADLWGMYWSGAGAGSSSGSDNGSLANDPTISAQYTGGSGGGRITPLVYNPESDGPPVFHSGVFTGDHGSVQFVQTADTGNQGTGEGDTSQSDGKSRARSWWGIRGWFLGDDPIDDGGAQVVQTADTGRTQRGVGTTAGDWLDRNFGGGTFGEPDFSGRVWAGFRGLFGFAPGAGEISDGHELIVGVGPNGEKLTPGQRGATAVGAMIPFVPGGVARRVLGPLTDKIDDAIEFMGDAGKAAGKNADSVDGAGRVAGDAADTAGQAAGRGGPYGHLDDGPTVGSAKPFTPAQKRKILEENRISNGGVLKDDVTGEIGQAPSQHKKGVTPPDNEVHIDHYYPKSEGGPNTFSNAEVRLRKNNLEKSDTIPGE